MFAGYYDMLDFAVLRSSHYSQKVPRPVAKTKKNKSTAEIFVTFILARTPFSSKKHFLESAVFWLQIWSTLSKLTPMVGLFHVVIYPLTRRLENNRWKTVKNMCKIRYFRWIILRMDNTIIGTAKTIMPRMENTIIEMEFITKGDVKQS